MHLISPKTEETVLLRSAKEDNKTKKGHKNRKKTKGSKAHKSIRDFGMGFDIQEGGRRYHVGMRYLRPPDG